MSGTARQSENALPALAEMLSRALAEPRARVIVRAPGGAVAEVVGTLTVSGGEEARPWLRLGEESGSHVHLDRRAVHRLRYVAAETRNAALELLDGDGSPLLRVSFGGTNPARPERYEPGRRAALNAAFEHLHDPEGR